MPTSLSTHHQVHSFTAELRQAIELELAAILGSPEFAASRRSCEFLAYIVGCALDGRLDLLKERTIGVAVFGRPASYDTGSDAAVRVRASEVRRRLRSYYCGRRSRGGWRVAIRPGSYAPKWIAETEECAVLTYVPGPQPALVIQGANPEAIRDAARLLGDDGPLRGTFRRMSESTTPARASIYLSLSSDDLL